MIDWTKSMTQTFEFYKVDVHTWEDIEPLDAVKSCRITRDETNETLEHATFDCTTQLDEQYIRVYLIAIQNGVKEKLPLGTFLVQTPSVGFDGKQFSISLDAYSPLLELKDDYPTLGYTLPKETNITDISYRICREHSRAISVYTPSDKKLFTDFVANTKDNWLTFVKDLLPKAGYRIALDERGRILFSPITDVSSLQPVWTFDDGNSSILNPNIRDERDLYGVPNVLEVIYSSDGSTIVSRIENTDPASPVSIPNRGRRVMRRDTSPDIVGRPSQEYLDAYAVKKLRDLSSLEHKVTFSHGFCPVRVGDCVMLDYRRFGLNQVKAKIISQNIKCGTGCTIETTVVYTTNLWR